MNLFGCFFGHDWAYTDIKWTADQGYQTIGSIRAHGRHCLRCPRTERRVTGGWLQVEPASPIERVLSSGEIVFNKNVKNKK